MKEYLNLKRYYMVKNGKVFDTSFIFPHTECYFIDDGKLYCEMIDGTECYLGVIVAQSNNLTELEHLAETYSEGSDD